MEDNKLITIATYTFAILLFEISNASKQVSAPTTFDLCTEQKEDTSIKTR
jgi:hypothetical protein